MRGSKPGSAQLAWALPGALAFLVVGSIVCVGSVGTIAIAVFSATAALAAALATFETRTARRVPSAKPWAVMLALGAFSALQSVPLPMPWLEALSPAAADIWSRSLQPLGESTSYGSISIDPTASLTEAAKWSAYGLTFFASARLARSRGAPSVVLIVAVAGAIVAISAIGHEILGAQSLFGIYRPRSSPARFVAPLLNANNLAGYLALSTMATLGLILARRPPIPRWLLASSVPVTVVTIFRSGSRGGVLALFVGVLCFAALLTIRWFSGKRDRDRAPMISGAVAIGLSVAAGIAFVLLDSEHRLFRELLNENTEKLRLASWSQPLIRDFPWLGVGRGGFESVFTAYRPVVGHHTIYAHPENFVVQWIAEWGLVVGGTALASLLWWFRPWRLRVMRSSLAGAVAAGLAALLLQNLVDLGLELFGIGLSVACLLGALCSQERRAWSSSQPAGTYAVRAFGALTIVVSTALLGRGARTLEEDRDEAKKLVQPHPDGSARTPAEVETALREFMMRHPADYYFPLLGAAAVSEAPNGRPMPWIQRALERGPTMGRPHLVLARALRRHGAANQALLELRLAVELEPELVRSAAPLAARYAGTPSELMRAVPEGSAGGDFLDLVGSLSVSRELAWREEVDRTALERRPELRGPRQRLVATRLDALPTGAPPCEDAELCRIEVEEHADELAAFLPRSSLPAQLRARLALVTGNPKEAADWLEPACDAPEDQAGCFQLLVHALGAARGADAIVGGAIERYLRSACMKREECALAHTWAAEFRSGRGEWGSAMNHQDRACREGPSEACWLALASAAERAQAFDRAADALEKARRLHGDDAALLGRIQENRRRAGQGVP